MANRRLEIKFCQKCGYLFINAGRQKGWTHHDGTNKEDGSPNWCTCRARGQVPVRLHDAILAAEKIAGRAAAQAAVDAWRCDTRRPAERITVARKNYSPYSGIYRGVHADRLIVDDPADSMTPGDLSDALQWYTKALGSRG